MINGINQEILSAISSMGNKKTKGLNASGEGFEALLALLLNQGINIQGNSIPGLETALQGGGDTSTIVDLLKGSKAQNVNPMEILQALGKDPGALEGNKGEKSLLFDALMGTFNDTLPSIESPEKEQNPTSTAKDADELTYVNKLSDLSETNIARAMTDKDKPSKADGNKLGIQQMLSIDSNTENTASVLKDNVLTEADDNKDADKLSDISVQSKSTKTEQYIVQRPEILRILKGTDASKENTTAEGVNVISEAAAEEGQFKVKGIEAKERVFSETFADKDDSKPLEKQHSSFHTMLNSKVAAENIPKEDFDSIRQYAAVDKGEILNQIYDKIKITKGSNLSELQISLRPEALGQVSIKLVMEKGVMTGRIIVENSQVKNLVETNLPQIKESLKDQNMNVSGLSVSVGLGQGSLPNGHGFSPDKWAYMRKAAQRPANLNRIEEGMAVRTPALQKSALNLLA